MFKEIFSISIILFSIIDIIGNIPVVISLKKQGKQVNPINATLASGALMIVFLFLGEGILHLFGVDVKSFALAGAIIILIIGLEMILGRNIFKEQGEIKSASVFPIAFPMIAGAGTLTTLISLKAEYDTLVIIIGILINLVIIFLVLRSSEWIQKIIGEQGAVILRKVFGIILLAIAIKLIKLNWA